MPSLIRLLAVGACCALAAACSFPTDGVLHAGDDTAADAAPGPDGDTTIDASDGGSCVAVAETCDGADQDCDDSIDEDFPVGDMCDGPDGDMCLEGTYSCDGAGGVMCSDNTDTIVETCNNADDDCDLAIDETFDLTGDSANCGACGNVCSNAHGTTSCSTSACAPVCDLGYADCDADPDNGCDLLLDTDPACSPNVTDLGTISGDGTNTAIVRTGHAETWFKVRLDETDNNTLRAITGRISLASPAGADYDLYVYCASCGGASKSSILDAGMTDVIDIGRDDGAGNRGFELFIEIVWIDTADCATWTLTVAGDTGGADRTCN